MAKIRLYFKIFGDVQGVGFRWYLQAAARRLGLLGWVGNSSDGTVRGEAEGERAKINKFMEEAKEGPDSARVVKVEKEERRYKNNFRDFEIKSL